MSEEYELYGIEVTKELFDHVESGFKNLTQEIQHISKEYEALQKENEELKEDASGLHEMVRGRSERSDEKITTLREENAENLNQLGTALATIGELLATLEAVENLVRSESGTYPSNRIYELIQKAKEKK